MLVAWLFLALRPFETVVQSISGRLLEREKEKREDRRDKSVVVVALLFYVNGKHLRSCRNGQLT